MKNKMALQLGLIVLITFTLSACYSYEVEEAEKPPLKISWTLSPGDYPMILASELGLFEKHGVEVDLFYNEEYRPQLSQFTAQSIDGFNSTLGDALLLAQEVDLKVVLISDSSAGSNAFVASNTINDPKDLIGKRVGIEVGMINSEMFFRDMLSASGLTLDDVTYIDIPAENIPEQIGITIDAGHTRIPHIERALGNGNRLLFTDENLTSQYPDVFIFHARDIEERPEDIQAFVNAWFEAVEYWRTNLYESSSLISNYVWKKTQSLALFISWNTLANNFEEIKIYTREDNQLAFEPGKNSESIYVASENNLEFMINFGTVNTAPDIEDLLDPTFVRE
jgi:NitT/TauT family transport system substrate-binding protein